MKTTFLTLSLLVAVLFANAQKTVLLKLKYLPGRNYLSNMQMKMKMKMDIDGDSASVAKVKGSGTNFPIVMDMTADMEMLMKTRSKPTTAGSLPFLMNYNKADVIATVNGNTIPIPNNQLKDQKVYGTCIDNAVLRIDSVPGKNMDEARKIIFAKALNDITRQLKFPDKPIAIGESFMMEVPMAVPVNGNEMQMMVKMTYKVTDIKNGIAFCDLISDASVDINVQQSVMKMKGNGTGKMQYSVKDQFFTTMTQDFTFSYSMNMDAVTMKGEAKMNSVYDMKISNSVN